ncbi:MAG TPA: DUF2939 domain-containing protein [Brevundimonas sp.]|uniref:DUF2939 domain-containing protein n=1 Tax=Brevundimonas sp. TaxID=1871086 RepID=UPI002EDA7646
MRGQSGSRIIKKLFGNLLVAAFAFAAISYFAAPAVGFVAIRSAADAGDVGGLTRLVDFTAVRQSLRPQLDGEPALRAPAPSFLDDPIGAVRRRLEQAGPRPAAAPDVDSYLSPQALAALTRGEGRRANQQARGTGSAMPRPVFWSVNRARMAVNGDGGARTVFTFERRGPFEWKLVHIGIPDRAAPTRAASPTEGR